MLTRFKQNIETHSKLFIKHLCMVASLENGQSSFNGKERMGQRGFLCSATPDRGRDSAQGGYLLLVRLDVLWFRCVWSRKAGLAAAGWQPAGIFS